jgi:peptidoglycan hydrolase-like protein with peptidoglycan-binding domain
MMMHRQKRRARRGDAPRTVARHPLAQRAAPAQTESSELDAGSSFADHRALQAVHGNWTRSAMPAAQRSVLQLQRLMGNQHMLRVLEQSRPPTLQRAPDGAGGARLQSDRFSPSAKLELCFEDKDRLRENDSDSDAVVRVQQALIDVSAITGNKYNLGPGGADGKYGPATAAAVRKFKSDENLGSTQFGDVGPGTMHRLDQLFGGTQPPKPDPNPKPVPKPNEQPASNPELEDTMDAIWLQYQMMLKQQNDSLNRLEKDLSVQEEPKDFNVELAKLTIKTAIGAILGPIGDAIAKFVKDQLKDGNMSDEDQKTVVDGGVKPIISAGIDFAKEKVSDKATEQDKSGAPKVDLFIEAQRGALDEGSDKSQETFLTQTKPILRKPPKTRPAVPGRKVPNPDPRVDAAKAHLKGVRKQKFSAGEKEYDNSLEAWALTLAQSKLKTTDRPIGKNKKGKEESVAVTDMTNAKGDTPGVISLEIEGGKPTAPVKLKKATVSGLSELVRKRLNRKNPSLLGLGLPILAAGKVSPGLLGTGLFADRIKIAQNEPTPPPPDVFQLTDDTDGKNWLKERAAARQGNLTPEVIKAADDKEGAKLVFDEDINNKTVSNIPGGLQAP